jgi:protein SCO1
MERKEAPIWIVFIALALVIGAVLLIRPAQTPGVMSSSFDFKPKNGEMLPVETQLVDEKGNQKTLGEYLRNGRPVLLLPIFYSCSGVCYTELESLVKMLVKESTVSTKKTADSVVPGRDFELVVISVHPKETFELGAAKKAEMMGVFRLGFEKLEPAQQEALEASLDKGIHFTVGKPQDIRKLTDAMGFYYTYDEKKNWVNHPAAAAYVSASGRIMGYNTGPSFASKTIRSAIASAASGKVEPTGDVFLLGCFKMASASKSTKIIVTMVNITCVLMVMGLSLAIYRWNKRFPSDTLSSGGPTA